MLQLRFNRKPIQVTKQSVLCDVLRQQGFDQQHFAVAINQQFIPRSQYQTTELNDGDCVDIITPMVGG